MNFDKKKFIENKIKSYYKNKYQNKIILKNMQNNCINERKEGGFNIIYSNIKNRIYKVFKENNIKFDITYDEIIGCSKIELEKYIINKLKHNMSIDNYNQWEIDHIIPVSSFNFTRKDNIFKCFNYKNLQPLWKEENRSKFNKIII